MKCRLLTIYKYIVDMIKEKKNYIIINQIKTIKSKKLLLSNIILIIAVFLMFISITNISYAGSLVDESTTHTTYPLDNYQLDFYVDTSWDWLPWNWTDGVGKQVMYGLYAITNFIWIISLYLSSATGYLVQQAYTLDFISDTANSIGKNIQILSGVSTSGFNSQGFYIGFLLIFTLILGIYVSYVGIIKKESSKAIGSITNFIIVFVLSSAFIAYAPDFITKVNDFSSDISKASLDLGTKMIMPNSDIKGKDSTDTIRKTLFMIQVQKPWYLLQYGNSENTNTDILSISPDENKGKDRQEAVKIEIEDNNNQYLTIPKVITRLGMVFFIFIFNTGITIFVFLLSGIMIFSQVLFIIYAMFLPISFLLSMLPTFENMSKKSIMKLFNTIMLKAGITLIVTIAFSISAMIYSLTINYPFFIIAFLQIVIFSGIYMKLSDIMSMFSLQSNDTYQVSRNILRKPYMMINQSTRKLERQLKRAFLIQGKDNLKSDSSKVLLRNKDIFRDNEYLNEYIKDRNYNNTENLESTRKTGINFKKENISTDYNNQKGLDDIYNLENTNKLNIQKNMDSLSDKNKIDTKTTKNKLNISNNKIPYKVYDINNSLSYKAGRFLGNVLEIKNKARDNISLTKQKIKDLPVNMKYISTKPFIDIQSGISSAKIDRQIKSMDSFNAHKQDILYKQEILENYENNKKPNEHSINKKDMLNKDYTLYSYKEKNKSIDKDNLNNEDRNYHEKYRNFRNKDINNTDYILGKENKNYINTEKKNIKKLRYNKLNTINKIDYKNKRNTIKNKEEY